MNTYTIKYDTTTNHILGIKTRLGKDICGALARSGAFETGHTFGDIRAALDSVGRSNRQLCRVCRIGAEITRNNVLEDERIRLANSRKCSFHNMELSADGVCYACEYEAANDC